MRVWPGLGWATDATVPYIECRATSSGVLIPRSGVVSLRSADCILIWTTHADCDPHVTPPASIAQGPLARLLPPPAGRGDSRPRPLHHLVTARELDKGGADNEQFLRGFTNGVELTRRSPPCPRPATTGSPAGARLRVAPPQRARCTASRRLPTARSWASRGARRSQRRRGPSARLPRVRYGHDAILATPRCATRPGRADTRAGGQERPRWRRPHGKT